MFTKITGKLVRDVLPDLGLAQDDDQVSWGASSHPESGERREKKMHGVIIEEASIVSVYDDPDAYRYCASRGLDDQLIEAWQIRYARRCRIRSVDQPPPGIIFSHRILIPIIVGEETWSVEGRMIRKTTAEEKRRVRKVLYPKNTSVDTLFGIDQLDRHVPLVLVEGLMDLARVRKVYPNSSTTFGIQIGPNQARQINEFDRVVELGDSDAGGDLYTSSLADLYDKELWSCRVPEKDPGDSTLEHIDAAIRGARPLADLLIERSGLFKIVSEKEDLRWSKPDNLQQRSS